MWIIYSYIQSVSQFSRSVVSDSSRPHESQHARPPCPSQIPGVYSNSCPSSRWCHPAISSSVVPFILGMLNFKNLGLDIWGLSPSSGSEWPWSCHLSGLNSTIRKWEKGHTTAAVSSSYDSHPFCVHTSSKKVQISWVLGDPLECEETLEQYSFELCGYSYTGLCFFFPHEYVLCNITTQYPIDLWIQKTRADCKPFCPDP